MARYRGQKALFEVIGGNARRKSAQPKAEPLRPDPPKMAEPVAKKMPVVQARPKERVVIPEKEVISWKPKPLQCHDGRIEITLSTRAATLVFMALVVGLLACFKVGQWYPGFETRPFITKENNVSPIQPGLMMVSSSRQTPVDHGLNVPPVSEISKRKIVPVKAVKSPAYYNAIVIQQFSAMPDLVAVGEFFGTRGIATEVVRKGSTYFLITRKRFPYNPEKPNTAGRDLLEQIRLLGQAYKAPTGLESFAPNRFKGAYGRNIDDQYIGEVTDVN